MGSSANQAATLADAVQAVGEQLIAANPIGKCFSIFFSLWFHAILLEFVHCVLS
jgi:hypothetical protein